MMHTYTKWWGQKIRHKTCLTFFCFYASATGCIFPFLPRVTHCGLPKAFLCCPPFPDCILWRTLNAELSSVYSFGEIYQFCFPVIVLSHLSLLSWYENSAAGICLYWMLIQFNLIQEGQCSQGVNSTPASHCMISVSISMDRGTNRHGEDLPEKL